MTDLEAIEELKKVNTSFPERALNRIVDVLIAHISSGMPESLRQQIEEKDSYEREQMERA